MVRVLQRLRGDHVVHVLVDELFDLTLLDLSPVGSAPDPPVTVFVTACYAEVGIVTRRSFLLGLMDSFKNRTVGFRGFFFASNKRAQFSMVEV